MNAGGFRRWSLSFSVAAIHLITVIWASSLIFSAVLILIETLHTGDQSCLNTFISETSETFRDSVVTIVIARTVGNIFEYNDGGIFGKSVSKE